MGVALNFLFKFLSWLGTILIMRQGAKAEERADSAEKTLEVINDLNRPRSDVAVDELWEKNKAKYR